MIKRDISIRLKNKNIFFISDIHSNLPALSAVMDSIPQDALIICSGDVVGYYVNPNEVCDILKCRKVVCIKGNHDKYVLGELKYPNSRESKYRIEWTRGELSASNNQWLKMLPDVLSIQIESCNGVENVHSSCQVINIAHGSPSDVEKYIYPDSDIDSVANVGYRSLVLGHTHHPMVRQHENGFVVMNPGSVGQPRDRIPGACFASIDVEQFDISMHRVNYSINEYQKVLRAHSVNFEMISILSRKKDDGKN